MKKTISLVLVLAICLSLCACGKRNLVESDDNAMNHSTESGIQQAPETLAPVEVVLPEETEQQVNTEPQYTTVEITLDNWQDYFELYEKTYIEENDFGEFKELLISYRFNSKEEFNLKDCDVTFEYSFDFKWTPYTVDFENKTVTFGDNTRHAETKQGIETLIAKQSVEDGVLKCQYRKSLASNFRSELEGEIGMVYNFEILRIQGTITIIE